DRRGRGTRRRRLPTCGQHRPQRRSDRGAPARPPPGRTADDLAAGLSLPRAAAISGQPLQETPGTPLSIRRFSRRMASPPRPRTHPLHVAPPPRTAPMPRILVAEDDPLVSSYIVRCLQSGGYEADAAHDGVRAIAMLAGGGYDCVLTDYAMPRAN